jgi:N-acetyl-anhydromuramyl-L-alanine amidase AmpD
VLKPNQGYHLRPSNVPYKSFIVHTTNGAPNSKTENELRFLVTSPAVSAHYLVGKKGEIYQILDPEKYIAWHAGAVATAEQSNTASIGVEVHFTPAEIDWTAEMWVGLTRLARMYNHLNILTHREIAVPKGRKIDPSGVTDAQFVSWKTSLHKSYKIAKTLNNLNVRKTPLFENNIIRTYPMNRSVVVDSTPVEGAVYNNSNLWYYCNWLGYVHSSLLELGGDV